MILLESFNNKFKMAEMDVNSGNMKYYCKLFYKLLKIFKSRPSFSGHYSKINGKIIVFYRIKEKLFLRVDKVLFELDDAIEVRWKRLNDFNCFSLLRNGRQLLELIYKRPKINPSLEIDTVSSFVEEEDFDFCLFIYNVMNNSERKKRIYREDL